MFRFRQFTVDDSHTAMKVGTDGVLLGAWARIEHDLPSPPLIVDIGCGCGLISLMLAQRFPSARIIGVEIDPLAASDAQRNVAASPFARRITVTCADFLSLPPFPKGTCYVCNPPFYTEDILAPDPHRATARHSSHLPLPAIIKHVGMSPLSVILPSTQEAHFLALCHSEGLHLRRICRVRTTERKVPKRVMMDIGPKASDDISSSELILLNPDGSRSEDYARLCQDFYL